MDFTKNACSSTTAPSYRDKYFSLSLLVDLFIPLLISYIGVIIFVRSQYSRHFCSFVFVSLVSVVPILLLFLINIVYIFYMKEHVFICVYYKNKIL